MSVSSQGAESWISAFCGHIGHEYFAEVSEDFIEDDFNLTGLQSQVPMYKEALEMILDVEPDDEGSLEDELEEDEHSGSTDASMHDYRRSAAERRALRMSEDASAIESSADLLYGLIHQRFITSRPGMQQMQEKYDMSHFGTCPRVYCRGARVLPVGCSDIPGQETVKLFCPACLDVYAPPNSRFQNVDGAFFGTTFGCLFFMTFPDYSVGGNKPLLSVDSMQPSQQQAGADQSQRDSQTINGVSVSNLAPGLSETAIYYPRIYGFKVSQLAQTGPRMQWLRKKPADVQELNEVDYMSRMNAVIEATEKGGKGVEGEGTGDSAAGEQDEDEGEEEEEEEEEEDEEDVSEVLMVEPEGGPQTREESNSARGDEQAEGEDEDGNEMEAAQLVEQSRREGDGAKAGKKSRTRTNSAVNGDDGGAAVSR